MLPADFVATVNAELEGRRARGNDHRLRRKPDRGRADRRSSSGRSTTICCRRCRRARGYAAVMLLIPSMVVSGGGNSNVQLSPGMIVFGGRGGRGNEGQSQIGRPRHRRRDQRRRRLRLRPARERAGSRDDDRRRSRRGGGGRADRQLDSEDRRQHVPEPLLRLGHDGLDAEQTTTRQELQERRA